jgi:hypothetical protein
LSHFTFASHSTLPSFSSIFPNNIEPTIELTDCNSNNQLSLLNATVNRYSSGATCLGSWWCGNEGVAQQQQQQQQQNCSENESCGGVVGEVLRRGRNSMCKDSLNPVSLSSPAHQQTLTNTNAPISSPTSPSNTSSSIQRYSFLSSYSYTPLPSSTLSRIDSKSKFLSPGLLPRAHSFLAVYPGLSNVNLLFVVVLVLD